MPDQFDMGPCDCCKAGAGLCCYTCCCPCVAYKEAADNVTPSGASSNGFVYCIVTFPLGFGCCALTVLGEEVAQKRGIDQGGIMCSCVKAWFDCCLCYSCSVLHESRLYKEQMAHGGVQTNTMQRK